MTKEKKKTMAEIFKEMIKGELRPLKEGDIVEGKILSVSKNKILVDLGGKSIGFISIREPGVDVSPKDFKPGEKVLACVIIPEDEKGRVILSVKKADRERIWRELKEKYDKKESLEVKVVDANRGGLIVSAKGIRGFLPVSQLAFEHYPRVDGDKEEILKRLKALISQNLKVKIINFGTSENKLVFSEKAARVEEGTGLKVGDIIKGKVSGIVDFGVFVNFPSNQGMEEGLIHISEISWGKVENLQDFVKVGDEIEAKIIDIEDGKISLSLKRLKPDPWLDLVKKYSVGQIVKGKISRIVPFGAFVKIGEKGEEIEGLVHVSELSDKKIVDPSKIVKEGEVYKFKILSIEPESRKISLSLKQVEEKEKIGPETSIEEISEWSDSLKEKLKSAEIKKLKDLLKIEDLTKIPGIGKVNAKKINNVLKKIEK